MTKKLLPSGGQPLRIAAMKSIARCRPQEKTGVDRKTLRNKAGWSVRSDAPRHRDNRILLAHAGPSISTRSTAIPAHFVDDAGFISRAQVATTGAAALRRRRRNGQ
jgi:hypothetical protein